MKTKQEIQRAIDEAEQDMQQAQNKNEFITMIRALKWALEPNDPDFY